MGILVTKLVKLSEDNTRSEEKKKKRDLKIFHLNNNIIVDKKKLKKNLDAKQRNTKQLTYSSSNAQIITKKF